MVKISVKLNNNNIADYIIDITAITFIWLINNVIFIKYDYKSNIDIFYDFKDDKDNAEKYYKLLFNILQDKKCKIIKQGNLVINAEKIYYIENDIENNYWEIILKNNYILTEEILIDTYLSYLGLDDNIDIDSFIEENNNFDGSLDFNINNFNNLIDEECYG